MTSKRVAVQPDARLAVDRVPAALQADREGGDGEHRRADRERAAGEHEVEHALAARVQVAGAGHDRAAYGPRASARARRRAAPPARRAAPRPTPPSRAGSSPARRPPPARAAALGRSRACAGTHVAEQEQRDAAAERERGARRSSASNGWPLASFSPGGDRDDPEQQQQVPVAEGVERQPRRARGGAAASAASAARRRRRRSRPTRGTRSAPGRARDDDELEVDRQLARADADRDDRLADRDHHDQPVALDEVRGRDLEAARRVISAASSTRARTPAPTARTAPCRPRSPPASTSSAAARLNGASAQRSPRTEAATRPRVNSPACTQHDREVGEAEREPAAVERVRDRERQHQDTPPSRRAAAAAARCCRARPRSSATRSRRTSTRSRRASARPAPRPRRRVVREHGRQLGDREDEDEVEEQLERRHPARGGAGAPAVRARRSRSAVGRPPRARAA